MRAVTLLGLSVLLTPGCDIEEAAPAPIEHSATMARAAECPCNVDPVAICSPLSTGDCQDLPALDPEELSTQLSAFATADFPVRCDRTGSLGSAGISIAAGDRDEVVVQGSRGTYGELRIVVERDRCLTSQRFRDGEIGVGTIYNDFYYVDGLSDAESAACRRVVRRSCDGR